MPKRKQNKNNKNKSKKKANKPRSIAVKGPNTSMAVNSALERVVHQTCSITNPFCAAARGSKYPDDTSLPTLPYQLHGNVALSTNASGRAGALFLPGFSYQYSLDSTVTVPGSPAYANLSSFSLTGLLPNSYRLVSWGVRVKSIAAPLNASGMVYIRLFNLAVGTQANSITATGWNAVAAANVPLRTCNDVTITSRPTSREFWNYKTPSTTNPDNLTTNWTNPGWSSISVYVEGGPASTAVLDFEVFYNYELTFSDDQSQALLATSSPQPNPMVTKASSYVYSKVAPIFTQGVQKLESYVWSSAKAYLAKAIAARIGPAASMLALTVD